ncbi:MAG: hypothetical protein MZV70_75480 [Desulfobacterales bacterium]|nr:hypothetical protein [Desulfobacterales bacterium]
MSISLDGAGRGTPRRLPQVPGAFDGALAGIEAHEAGGAGVPDQHDDHAGEPRRRSGRSTTWRIDLGAAAHHIFLLVPTGRGKEMADQAITPQDYEETLNWFYDAGAGMPRSSSRRPARRITTGSFTSATEHEGRSRLSFQTGTGQPLHAMTRGCLGGSAFCFISHAGRSSPAATWSSTAARSRTRPLRRSGSTRTIFTRPAGSAAATRASAAAASSSRVCGGCRARAYEATGDYLAEEPLCIYEPGRRTEVGSAEAQ